MAIAPSKLGEFVAARWNSEDAFLRGLRATGLVKPNVPDRALAQALAAAKQEHRNLPEPQRMFNSPHERVRVFLAPLLSNKGRQWAVPGESLKLPDEAEAWAEAEAVGATHSSVASPVKRWWRFW
jgi:hypothetical protein